MESSTSDTAPSTEEALTAFFTPGRRQYYRDLHSRYQLWSGDFEAIDRPETYRWDPNCRLRVEAQRLSPATIALIEHRWPYPHSEHPPVPELSILYDRSTKAWSSDRIEPIDQLVEACLISAVIYTTWRWRKEQDPVHGQLFAPRVKVLERWADRLAHIMTRPDQRVVGNEAEGGPTGWSLFLLREQYLMTPPSERKKREKLRERLQDYWLWIGRDAGFLPRVAGGAATTLPDWFLERLATETQSLIAEVRSYRPAKAELQEIRSLIMGRTDPVTEEQRGILRERPSDRKELERSMIDRLDKDIQTKAWARRLRFPFLTESELDEIVKMRTSATERTGSLASAARILSPYLGFAPKTIENRVGKYRSA